MAIDLRPSHLDFTVGCHKTPVASGQDRVIYAPLDGDLIKIRVHSDAHWLLYGDGDLLSQMFQLRMSALKINIWNLSWSIFTSYIRSKVEYCFHIYARTAQTFFFLAFTEFKNFHSALWVMKYIPVRSLDVSLITTILTFSSLGLIIIYLTYLHNLTCSSYVHTTTAFSNPLPWAALWICIEWTVCKNKMFEQSLGMTKVNR